MNHPRWTSAFPRSYSKRWIAGWMVVSFLAGLWLVLNIPLAVSGLGFLVRMLFTVALGLVFGSLLFFLTAWIAKRVPGWTGGRAIDWMAGLYYALPMFASWSIYLLAFWPGMMSADSMDQWGQVLSGQYNDWHPAFHTLTIWLLTRIALSPAVVAAAQILGLALVAGAVLAFLQRQGVPRPILWIACAVFAISPVNGTMVNTLWKDIPYSTAVLGITLLLAETAVSKGAWLASWKNRILLGVTAALVTLFRHDGLTVGFGSLAVLLVAFPKRWLGVLAAAAVSLVLFFGIRGPLYQAVGVQQQPEVGKVSASLYTVAAYARPGSPASAVFSEIGLSPQSWDCSIWSRLVSSQDASLDRQASAGQVVVNLVQRAPKALLYSYRCNRSMAWIIWDPNKMVDNTAHVRLYDDPNPYGIFPDSKIPGLRTVISDFVLKTATDTNLNWLVWRPALYLYLFLFVIFIQVLRSRDMRLLAITAPVLIQSVGFTLLLVNPNFRYYYATYLLSLAFWPLAFAAPAPRTAIIPEVPLDAPAVPSNASS